MNDLNPRTVVYRAKPISGTSGIEGNDGNSNSKVATSLSSFPKNNAVDALLAKKLKRDREKARNVCRSVMIGLGTFFLIVVSSMMSFRKNRISKYFSKIFGTTDDINFNGPKVYHTTHLKADLDVVAGLPFHQRVFHRDLNVQKDGEEREENFVYGRPVSFFDNFLLLIVFV